VAVAAAHVGHGDAGIELLHHAVERRQPLRHQAAAIGVAVERRHATVQTAVVLTHATPLPVRNAAMAFSSSNHIDAGTCHALGMNTGLSWSASTIACSGESS